MKVRERVIAQATELFMKEGVRRVTMDHLAASLGISKRTIYELYGNKDELLRECIETHIETQKVAFAELVADSETAIHLFLSMLKIGVENMKSHNPQFINDVRIYHHSIWNSTLCANREFNIEQTIKILQRGINEGVFRGDMDIPIISKLIIEFFSLLANSDVFPYHKYPPSILYEYTMLTLVRGIASPKGLQMIEELTSSKQST
jgi:AcrR family transcriptional regulator